MFAGAEPLGTGHGVTKQEAEQDAARAALEKLLGAVSETTAAKQAKPRTRRTPRKPRATSGTQPESPATPEPEAEVVPLRALEVDTNHEPPATAPRSRQFGEPID